MIIFKLLAMAVCSFELKRMWGSIHGQWGSILLGNGVQHLQESQCLGVAQVGTHSEHLKEAFTWGWERSSLSNTRRSQIVSLEREGWGEFSEMRQLTTLNSILHSWEGSTFHSFSHKEIHACILLINFPFLALAIYPIHLGFWFL